MSYISLFNKYDVSGDVSADNIVFNGLVDFTNATPIIGLVDELTLKIIDNPNNGLIKNIIQIKDNGVTNIKIVSMDADKLTGNISIDGILNKILFKLVLDMEGNNIINIGDILPINALSTIGKLLNPFLDIYASNGNFDTRITTPIINNSLGVTLQYNNNDVLKTTMSGLTITGSVIFNSSSVVVAGNIYPMIDDVYTIGINTNRWNSIYTKNIDSSEGVLLKYNGNPRLSINDVDIVTYRTIKPSGDNVFDLGTNTFKYNTAYLNNIIGNPITLKNNGVDRIITNSSGIDIYGEIQIINGNLYPLNSSLYDIGRSTRLWNNGYIRYLDYPTGPIMRYNGDDRFLFGNNGNITYRSLLTSVDNLYDLGIFNSNRFRTAYFATSCVTPAIIGQTTLSISATTAVNISFGGAVTDALNVGGSVVKNRKIVLFNVGNDDHQYYGFGINGGTLRYQAATSADGHRFYCGLNSSSSQELMSIYNNGITIHKNLNMINNNINNVSNINTTNIKTSGFVSGHRSVSSNTTITESDTILSVNTSSISISLTLPLVSSLTYSSGRQWIIKDISGFASRNNIILITTAPNLLDGSNKLIIKANYSSISIYCDGSNYFIF